VYRTGSGLQTVAILLNPLMDLSSLAIAQNAAQAVVDKEQPQLSDFSASRRIDSDQQPNPARMLAALSGYGPGAPLPRLVEVS